MQLLLHHLSKSFPNYLSLQTHKPKMTTVNVSKIHTDSQYYDVEFQSKLGSHL
ncbi:hypothetical protein MtrunA17_Chr7g0232221 [Medicago truncatula]|uniref:Uncharacterized protein n=1 Tax=Medicago truncatula TaxID=3880 RepID=A0A396GWM0_MEDTR|nr:hypothetical protein MtrunA17_Chr7g0232221 [Medicago truncatula]